MEDELHSYLDYAHTHAHVQEVQDNSDVFGYKVQLGDEERVVLSSEPEGCHKPHHSGQLL